MVALISIFIGSLAGCATDGTYDPGRSAGAGALGGAATGAAIGSIVGAATGHAGTGAWVGAAAGGVAGAVGGFLYAEHRSSQARSSQAAAQSYNYTPAQGNVVSIDRVDANPSTVRPGQQVQLGMTYTILTPDNNPVAVTLVREVRFGGSTVGQPYQTTVNNQNGTFTDQVAYSLPGNATRGTYTVTSRINSTYGSTQRDGSFTVR
ncbi:MAG: hypothetical protein KKD99_05510 [Proteobacteria bacterium]|nr:hypothetical protein [Pseudomonadota bacterium]